MNKNIICFMIFITFSISLYAGGNPEVPTAIVTTINSQGYDYRSSTVNPGAPNVSSIYSLPLNSNNQLVCFAQETKIKIDVNFHKGNGFSSTPKASYVIYKPKGDGKYEKHTSGTIKSGQGSGSFTYTLPAQYYIRVTVYSGVENHVGGPEGEDVGWSNYDYGFTIVFRDVAPPTVPANLRITSTTYTVGSTTWVPGGAVTFAWNHSTDQTTSYNGVSIAASGRKDYGISAQGTTVTANTTYSFTPSQENTNYSVKVLARDYNNNISNYCTAVTFKVDKSGPNRVSATRSLLLGSGTEGVKYSWTTPSDNNGSGIKNYNYTLVNEDSNTSVNSSLGGDYTNILFPFSGSDSISRDVPYIFIINSIDNCNNQSGNMGYNFYIPSMLSIKQDNGVLWGDTVSIGGNDFIPCYKGRIFLADNDNFTESRINRIHNLGVTVERSLDGLNWSDMDVFTVASNSFWNSGGVPGESENGIIGTNGLLWYDGSEGLVYDFKLIGADHAHEKYYFRIKTTHTINGINEYSAIYEAPEIPNYKSNYSIEIYKKDEQGTYTIPINDSYIFDTRSFLPVEDIFLASDSDELRIMIIPDNLNIEEDMEGDEKSYRLYYTVDGTTFWTKTPTNGSITFNPHTDVNSLSNVKYYILCNETWEISENEPKTELGHTLGGPGSYSFTFYYDNSIDPVSLTCRHRPEYYNYDSYPENRYLPSSDTDLSTAVPCNRPEVLINIFGINTDDPSGLDKLILYNILLNDLNYYSGVNTGEKVKSYIESLIIDPPQDNQIMREISVPSGEGVISMSVENDLLGFDLGGENPIANVDKTIVAVSLSDRAGNLTYSYAVIALDTTAPDMPELARQDKEVTGDIKLEYAYPSENNPDSILVKGINKGEEVLRYFWYNGQGENYEEDPEESKDFNVNGFSANEEIPCKVLVADRAGNYTEFEGSLFTLPEAGELIALEGEYYEIGENTFGIAMKWQVPYTAGASYHFLEVKRYGESNPMTAARTGGGLEGETFILSESDGWNLQPHGTYDLKLIPYNGLGDSGPVKEEYRSLKNNPPIITQLRPSEEHNQGWSNKHKDFQWSCVDPDGDSLSYILTVEQGGSVIWTLETNDKTVSPSTNGFTEGFDFLIEGNEYVWYVRAFDEFEKDTLPAIYPHNDQDYDYKNVISEGKTILIDNTAPVIMVLTPNADLPFRNNSVYRFSLEDPLSGLNSAELFCESSAGGLLTPNGTGTGEYELSLEDGIYELTISIKDLAGNEAVEKRRISLDTVKPRITEGSPILIDGTEVGNDYLTFSSAIPVSFSMTDTGSGIWGFYYRFISPSGNPELNSEETFISINNNIDPENPTYGMGNWVYNGNLRFKGISGVPYKLEIRPVDWAGNTVDPGDAGISERRLVFDETAPLVHVALASNLPSSGGTTYLTNRADLEIAVTAEDPESGITGTEYSFEEIETMQNLGWVSNLGELRSKTLLPGGKYRVLVRAVNGTGRYSTASTGGFMYDPSGPDNLAMEFLSASTDLVPGESLRIKLSALDNESGIARYTIAVGSSAGGTEVSERINGNVSGYLITNMGREGLFSFALPDLEDGTYYITAKAENGAGLSMPSTGLYTAGSFTVSREAEKIVITEPWPYSTQKRSLSCSWSYSGPRTVNKYYYRIEEYIGDVLISNGNWTETTENGANVYFGEGEELSDGYRYAFRVKALFIPEEGQEAFESSEFVNRGTIIDTSAPEFIAELKVPYASAIKDLAISWGAEDNISGIDKVEVFIRSITEDPDGYAWEELASLDLVPKGTGSNVFITKTEDGETIEIASGTKVYITLRVTNGAGIPVDITSPAVIIDNTPPPEPFVIDQGDYHNFQNDNPVAFQWLWSREDSESGIKGYKWTVLNDGVSLESASWSDITEEKEVVFADSTWFMDIEEGETIYFAVKAVNKAGLESIGISNGIIKDSTRPDISFVKLTAESGGGAGDMEVNYINRRNDLGLYIAARENESNIVDYVGERGGYDENGDWTRLGEVMNEAISSIPISLPAETVSGDIIFFRGYCTDEAGNNSEYGYTGGVMYDESRPVVFNIHGVVSGDMLHFDWDAGNSLSPVREYTVQLVGSGITWTSLVTKEKRVSFNTGTEGLNLQDDFYELRVSAINMAGNTSEETAKSGLVMVDRTPAEITNISNDPFTSKKISFDITALENLSRIEEFQYAVGTVENPTALSGKWVSRITGSSTIAGRINFADLPGGTEGIQDTSRLYVKVRVKNSAGLWSEEAAGNPTVVDKTPADVGSFRVDKALRLGEAVLVEDADMAYAYTNNPGSIRNILFEAADGESGVIGYRLALVGVSDPNQVIPESAWKVWANINEPGAATDYLDFNTILGGLSLVDNGQYYLALQVQNGSYDYSGTYISNVVLADFTPPVIAFDITELLKDTDNRVIYNDNAVSIGYDISEYKSEKVVIQFSTVDPQGFLVNDYAVRIQDTPYNGTDVFTFLFPDPENLPYGTHVLKAAVTDAAGNRVADAAQTLLRVNRPPTIILPAINTTPGRPNPVHGNDPGWVKDTDTTADNESLSDYPLTYEWSWGDGTGTSSNAESIHEYYHSAPENQITEYTLSLKVTDFYGKSATAETAVKVLNTTSGKLHCDEYWNSNDLYHGGSYKINGSIEVPPDIVLIIEEGNLVEVVGTPGQGAAFNIDVAGSIFVGESTEFRLAEGQPYPFWDGIRVTGFCEMNNVTIRGAERGLTLTDTAEAEIEALKFIRNRIGLHLIGCSPPIIGHTFIESLAYGIKEDNGADPVVADCHFSGNTFDYYDQYLTVMDYIELNTAPGNSGNYGD